MATIALSANSSWYIYNFRANTIRSFINSGHDVIVIAPVDRYSKKISMLGAHYTDIYIDCGGSNPYNDMKTVLNFISIYKKNKIDVVLNFTPKNNIYSTISAKLFNIRVVNNIAGLGYLFTSRSFSSKIAKFLYRVSQNLADKVFFQNDDDLSLFLSYGFVNESKVDRLPGSGVDLSRFRFSISGNVNVVKFLLVSRMLFDKGIAEYVNAARYLKNRYGNLVEFNMLGFLDVDNPSAVSSTQMKEWVDEGIVNYLGTSDNVESEIAKIDCIVLPSFYREGVPKVLLEAGAMGKPIVTTNNVGCRDTVDHGVNGFLCEPRSYESLVNELDKIISMSYDERVSMGRKSRAKIESEFDEKFVIEKYLSTVDSLLTLVKHTDS